MALKLTGCFENMNQELEHYQKSETLLDKIPDLYNNISYWKNLEHVDKKFWVAGGRVHLTLMCASHYCALVGTRSSVTMPKVVKNHNTKMIIGWSRTSDLDNI